MISWQRTFIASSTTAELHRRHCGRGDGQSERHPRIRAAQQCLLGVTGALIFNAGIFAQVLEGDRQDVALTFERIQRDTRHGDVQVLAFEEVQNRDSRVVDAFVGRSQEGENLFGHIGEVTGFEAKRMEGERIFEIMRAIAIEEEARAAAA